MRWYHDNKVQMMLNTYWPNRQWFRAHFDVDQGKWIDE